MMETPKTLAQKEADERLESYVKGARKGNETRKNGGGMRLVTVHLPVRYIEGIDDLVKDQWYPNRSECIRNAIRDLLIRERGK